jgi:predicted AlkP superfamily pyrophosphatase or phosphodiesterase
VLNKSQLFALLLLPVIPAVAHASEDTPPKLILQITVDALRGDMPDKFMKNMGEGGFRYLKQQGVWFANANYSYANTETVVGHTTLATGAFPAEHGMVSNVWFDRETNKLAYNIEDPRFRLLTTGGGVDKNAEVDSTQALASADGRSPANILVSTFSDELAMRTNGQAKIFGISVKDRGAVPLAGHAGKAFWFSKATGDFVTSSYYYDRYPAWVDSWNNRNKAAAYADQSWDLMLDNSAYMFGAEDDQPWEMDMVGFGRTFPHQFGAPDNKYFASYLTFSPVGDDLTLDFAKTVIEAEDMGQDDVTDYLAVSFSSTDYIGHLFGPSSLEAEDNMLRLDRTLAALFAYVDERVGLENTLIVLSADHGQTETPGYLNSVGLESDFVSPDRLDKEPAIAALKQQFGIGQDLIQSYFPPYLYLNREVIREKGLDQGEVERAVARHLMEVKGIALAVSGTAMRNNQLPDTFLNRAATRNFYSKRSGDILVLFRPHYFVNDFGGEVTAANHGGPWRYDTNVPVVFAGMNLGGRRVYDLVDPVDVARTLAAIAGTKAPSAALGAPYRDVMELLERP